MMNANMRLMTRTLHTKAVSGATDHGKMRQTYKIKTYQVVIQKMPVQMST